MFRAVPTRVALATLALASLAWQGCTSDSFVTAPGDDRSTLDTAVRRSTTAQGPWTVVASEKIIPGQVMTLSGSRYTLDFPQGAVHNAMEVTISERDAGLVDVKLDPDGTVFGEPVTLRINYTGTSSDPDSPFFNGVAPQVGRYNTVTKGWDLMSGTDDAGSKTFTVMLTGFSRYAMNDGMLPKDSTTDSGHNQTIR